MLSLMIYYNKKLLCLSKLLRVGNKYGITNIIYLNERPLLLEEELHKMKPLLLCLLYTSDAADE